jgi:hypothetical protein
MAVAKKVCSQLRWNPDLDYNLPWDAIALLMALEPP